MKSQNRQFTEFISLLKLPGLQYTQSLRMIVYQGVKLLEFFGLNAFIISRKIHVTLLLFSSNSEVVPCIEGFIPRSIILGGMTCPQTFRH